MSQSSSWWRTIFIKMLVSRIDILVCALKVRSVAASKDNNVELVQLHERQLSLPYITALGAQGAMTLKGGSLLAFFASTFISVHFGCQRMTPKWPQHHMSHMNCSLTIKHLNNNIKSRNELQLSENRQHIFTVINLQYLIL